MIRLFSKRHEDAIFQKKIQPSLSKRLRRRIYALLVKHDFSYDDATETGYRYTTSVLQQAEPELCRRYGQDKLVAFNDSDQRVPVGLEGFALGAYPSQVFDLVELFSHESPPDVQIAFQRDLNNALEEEKCPWRLTDGQFFKVDSEFLEANVVARSYELLKVEGYEGALDEFNEARNDLTAGDFKGAIHNACKSVESVLKIILRRDSGNASTLIRGLLEDGFYSDVPEEVARAFGEQVLMALPFLRNKLGAHGQGGEILDVPRHYAELSIHLAASFLLFIIQKAIAQRPPQQEETEPKPDRTLPPGNNEIPF